MSIFDIDFNELNVLFGLTIFLLLLGLIVFFKRDQLTNKQCSTKDEDCEGGVCKINPHQF